MVQQDDAAGRHRPQFFDDRGVPSSIEPPDDMVGVYVFSRDDSEADSDRTYTRKGVLTSEGWVPPVSKILVHTVAKSGDGPNDLSAIGNYTVGKATRVAIDPRELRSKLSGQGEIVEDDVSPVILTKYRDDVEIYVPDGLDDSEVAEYLRGCVRPATQYYLDTHDGEQPSREELANILADVYGVSHEAALLTVDRAIDAR
jgi:hypothetical protein